VYEESREVRSRGKWELAQSRPSLGLPLLSSTLISSPHVFINHTIHLMIPSVFSSTRRLPTRTSPRDMDTAHVLQPFFSRRLEGPLLRFTPGTSRGTATAKVAARSTKRAARAGIASF